MTSYSWLKKGLRPSGFPIIRLHQFIELIKVFNFTTDFINLEVKKMIDYFYEILSFQKVKNSIINLEFSRSAKNNIISNSFVLFLWWFGKIKSNETLLKKAIDVLTILDSEENSITKKWSNLGLTIKKSYDSQALLEIYSEYCSKKKCMNCVVGNKILKD